MGRATGRNNKELGALQLIQGLLGTLGSAGRGLVAGTTGLPGDIESLLRMIPGLQRDQTLSDQVTGKHRETWLPTTEEMGKALPQLPANYRQPVAEGLGQMGAMTPGQVGKLGQAGKAGALALMDRAMAPSRVAQAGAVKPRGGNWLKSEGTGYLDDLLQKPPMLGRPNDEARAIFEQNDPVASALNNWVRGPMTKYIKRDLGTAEDPLLRLADEGISTLPKDQLLNPPFWVRSNARESRKMSGLEQPELGGYARGWSYLADGMVLPVEVGGVRTGYGSHWGGLPTPPDGPYWGDLVQREGEWLGKLPDEAKVYQFTGDESLGHLGFGELIQTLKRGLEAGNELPPGLRLKPEDFKQMGMEKAVRYMDNVGKYKEQQKVRMMKDTMLGHGETVKEYPAGYKWADLKLPEKGTVDPKSVRQNPDGTWSPIDAEGNVMQRIETHGMGPVDVIEPTPERAHLGGQLGAEGILMEHCVGGYCDEVANGRTRIVSLRNTKTGQPHVTLELSPERVEQTAVPGFYELGDAAPQELLNELYKTHGRGGIGWINKIENDPRWMEYAKSFEPPKTTSPARVRQVKGGANSRPKDEYQSFISDFFKTNPHEFEGDLHNTDLKRFSPAEKSFMFGENGEEFRPWTPNIKDGYYTPEDILQMHLDQKPEGVNDNFWNGYIGSLQREKELKDGGMIYGDDDFAIPGHF